jgi:hypothetical protein
MARVTGIGGVFFKSASDHQRLAAWYRDNLGIALEPWGGAILKWPDDRAPDGGLTVWHVAERDSKWFSPSASPFMINYRVDERRRDPEGPRRGGERHLRVGHGSRRQQGGAVGAQGLMTPKRV